MHACIVHCTRVIGWLAGGLQPFQLFTLAAQVLRPCHTQWCNRDSYFLQICVCNCQVAPLSVKSRDKWSWTLWNSSHSYNVDPVSFIQNSEYSQPLHNCTHLYCPKHIWIRGGRGDPDYPTALNIWYSRALFRRTARGTGFPAAAFLSGVDCILRSTSEFQSNFLVFECTDNACSCLLTPCTRTLKKSLHKNTNTCMYSALSFNNTHLCKDTTTGTPMDRHFPFLESRAV